MANFWGGWTPPRHSGTWAGARVASLRCHYPPPRRSQYSRNAEAQPHKSKTSCRGAHRRGTTTSGPGCGPLAAFGVTAEDLNGLWSLRAHTQLLAVPFCQWIGPGLLLMLRAPWGQAHTRRTSDEGLGREKADQAPYSR